MSHNTIDYSELWPVAEAMADAARDVTLRYFRQPGLAAESKAAHFDPVTLADREAEAVMREILEAERPDDGIFGEEHGVKEGTSGVIWVLDPIDGTRGYISGTPTWGVLVAAGDDEGPKLGLVDQPFIGERFMGGGGRASTKGPLGERDLAVRQVTALDQAVLYTTFPEVGQPEEGAAFERVKAQAKLTRYGCDCYAYALLAAGQIDLVIEAGLQSYDIQAPLAVIEAAGGIVTNWQGGPAHQGGQVVASATPELHRAAMELLA